MERWQGDIRDLFPVLAEPVRTARGIRLVVDTVHGPKTLWASRKWISLFRYREDGRTVIEAGIPVWLQEKAGLN